MARWYWREDSAGDGARSEENKEGKEERAEVEIELCEKGETESSFVFSFALSLRLIRFPP